MAFKIPLFDLNYDTAEEEAVIRAMRSKWISTGPACTKLEDTFCKQLNVKYALATSNCTAALHLALKVLDLNEGDEVIVPSLSFVATVNAIKYVQCKPVFADIISNAKPTISPDDIKSKITKRTKAIVIMHYAGFPCYIDEIMNIARKHKLKVIEDAAHAPFTEYKGKVVGSFGDIACFSFFSNKSISTGEGGLLVTNNEQYYARAKLLRSHGMTSLSYERATGHATRYDVLELGYNYRLDDIRASIALAQIVKLAADYKKREQVRKWYIEELSEIEQVTIPFKNNTEYVSNHIFPIVLKNANEDIRDRVRQKLQDKGIQTSVHYPAIHRFTIYSDYYCELPNTDYYSNCEITLPMYASLSKKDVKYITSTINKNIKE